MLKRIAVVASVILGFIIAFGAGFLAGRSYDAGQGRRGGYSYTREEQKTDKPEQEYKGPRDMGEFSDGIKRAFEGK